MDIRWKYYLELWVDGSHVDWGDFNPSHTYTICKAGTGSTMSFKIKDSHYSDNSGSLTVKIYERACCPVAVYHMNEGAGSSVYDETVYNNDGSVDGATWTTSGKFGGCLDFDGSGDHVSVPDNDVFDFGTGGFTVEAWIKTTSGNRQWIVSRYEYHGPGWGLFTENNKAMAYIRTVESGSGKLEIAGTSNIADGNWHHLVLVRTGNYLEIYVDGSKENSGTLAGNVNDDEPVWIGPSGCHRVAGSRFLTVRRGRVWCCGRHTAAGLA